MAEEFAFGALVARLADRRRLSVSALSRLADVSESDLLPLFDSGTPSPPVLRRLATALELHTADLFAIAGVDLPEDLAPMDREAGQHVPDLVRHAVALPPEKRDV